ncbi:MAG: transcription antitermination factor NusB [Actinomycetota bacterium]|nr:transcription antitermination factor NusB [Actinomycetota bacterium]MDQ3647494.1 transcription antitermination factor NusB [Actinomycetota bacterium]
MRRSDQRRAAVVALYQSEVTGRPPGELLEPTAQAFTRELVAGVEHDRPDLDAVIEHYSVGWPLDRIAPLEKSILRVALHELTSRPDVPPEVAIDEAVEAAKELCSVETPKFLNGVLGSAHRAATEAPAQ